MNLFKLKKKVSLNDALNYPCTQVRTISNKHLGFVRQSGELLHLKARKNGRKDE